VALYSYLSSEFKTVFVKITVSLFLLSFIHALIYALKSMQSMTLPMSFFFLFCSKDLFRSLPFIVNLSFLLSLVSWQHALRLKKYDLIIALCNFSQKTYYNIILFFLLPVVVFNLLCLFVIVPLLNYKLDTELETKMFYHSLVNIPENHSIEIERERIFYAESVKKLDEKKQYVFKNVKLLTFDEQRQPFVIAGQKAILNQDRHTLSLIQGVIYHFSKAVDTLSEISFENLEYQLLFKESLVELSSLSFEQLIKQNTPESYGLIFWSLYLAFLPFSFFSSLLQQKAQITFSGSLHFELIIAISLFLFLMIMGVSARSFIESNRYLFFFVSLLVLFIASIFFRHLYQKVAR
jgi:hypothetical protein